jgi:predicted nucleic acid-binding protein
VLRSAYGLTSVEVAKALGAFCGLARVTLEDAALIAKALQWTVGGMDFADALHLAKTEGCDAMVSFDRQFASAALKLSNIEVRTL